MVSIIRMLWFLPTKRCLVFCSCEFSRQFNPNFKLDLLPCWNLKSSILLFTFVLLILWLLCSCALPLCMVCPVMKFYTLFLIIMVSKLVGKFLIFMHLKMGIIRKGGIKLKLKLWFRQIWLLATKCILFIIFKWVFPL